MNIEAKRELAEAVAKSWSLAAAGMDPLQAIIEATRHDEDLFPIVLCLSTSGAIEVSDWVCDVLEPA